MQIQEKKRKVDLTWSISHLIDHMSHFSAWNTGPPGMLAGDSGPVRGVLALAGEPAGEGEGPRIPGRWGDVWGEKGDWAWLLCSPWLLDTPEVLTPGLRAPSVPVGKSSMDPDRSWKHTGEAGTGSGNTFSLEKKWETTSCDFTFTNVSITTY